MMKAGAMLSSTSRGRPFSYLVISAGAEEGPPPGMLDVETGSAGLEPGVGAGAEDLAPIAVAGVPPTLHQEESHQGPCKHSRLLPLL